MVLNDKGKAVPFASLDKDLVKNEPPSGGNEGKSEEPSARPKRTPKSGTTTPTKKGDTYVVVFEKDYNEDEIVDRLEEIVERAVERCSIQLSRAEKEEQTSSSR